MEVAASLPATHLHGFTKTPNSSPNSHCHYLLLRLNRRCSFHRSRCFSSLHLSSRREGVKQWPLSSFLGDVFRNQRPVLSITMRVASVSDSAEGNGQVESEDLSALGDDVIVLDVQGMMCGGCTDSVKRILESKSQVSSASVNLEAESAVVCVNAEAKVSQNWKQQLGDELANHLTTCGFKSNLRVS